MARQNLTVPRLFARFGTPHADPARVVRGNGKGDIYTPSSGRFVRRDGEEWLLARSGGAGLPWGKWARMIVILLATEARRRNHRTVRLPRIGRLLEALGTKATGGATGSIDALKSAFTRLLTASFIHVQKGFGNRELFVEDWCDWMGSGSIGEEPHIPGSEPFLVAESFRLWDAADRAEIELSKEFYRICTVDYIEVDKNTVMALQRNVSALEAYLFANHIATAGHIGSVSLASSTIARQLGYACPGYECKARFIEAVGKVQAHWPEIDVDSKAGEIDQSIGMPDRQGSITIRVGLPHVVQLTANDRPQTGDEKDGVVLVKIRRKSLVEQLQTATVREFKSRARKCP